MQRNEIRVVGILQPEVGSGKVHFQDYIYGSDGVARTLCSRDFKDPIRVLICKTKTKS